MSATLPLELIQLLETPDAEAQAVAWDQLIAKRTRLLLAVARSLGGSHDEMMDRYAFILGKLREDDFRRLRSFRPDRGASFDTWLAVASRRLCLDHHRTIYGRVDPTASRDAQMVRRALAHSVASELDVNMIADLDADSAETRSVREERNAALGAAIDALPSSDKLLLSLRFGDDLSAARISVILGLATPFHVYRQLDRVLSVLRCALEKRGIRGSDG